MQPKQWGLQKPEQKSIIGVNKNFFQKILLTIQLEDFKEQKLFLALTLSVY